MSYTEEQIDEFLALAQEIGIGRARRELGWPAYSTALRWAENRGVSVNVDPVMQTVKQFNTLYTTEHMLEVVKEGVSRVYEQLVEARDLTPDDQKKLSEAFHKYSNQWLVLQGKASSINESHSKDGIDLELMDLVMKERAKNANLDKHDMPRQNIKPTVS